MKAAFQTLLCANMMIALCKSTLADTNSATVTILDAKRHGFTVSCSRMPFDVAKEILQYGSFPTNPPAMHKYRIIVSAQTKDGETYQSFVGTITNSVDSPRPQPPDGPLLGPLYFTKADNPTGKASDVVCADLDIPYIKLSFGKPYHVAEYEMQLSDIVKMITEHDKPSVRDKLLR